MGLTLVPGKNNGRIYPYFRYTKAGYTSTKIQTGTPCKLNHWDNNTQKITRGDKEYKSKNQIIKSLRTKLEYIVNHYVNNDLLLTPQLFILEFKKKGFKKEEVSVQSLPLLSLVENWEKEYLEDKQINPRTKSKTKSVVKDIKTFIVEVEKGDSNTLLINNLNDKFCRDFLTYLFNKPNKTGGKLQPYTVSRRFRYLQTFCNWYSKESGEFKKIKIPKELGNALKISDNETPLCLFERELVQLVNFKEFNFLKPLKNDKGKIDWIESDKWEKHLTSDRQNRGKKSGVLEFLYEDTNYGKQTYTTWEVYLDFLVFSCTVGCRYGDGIRMKVKEDIKHTKRDKNSPIRDGLDGFFKYKQRKTNREATPRINEISMEIYRKYSRGKEKGDYLFPKTKNGNFLPDSKINKHLKQICKTIGLKRKIEITSLGSKGVELNKEEKQLWELVSTHIGRRTYIKTMVLKREYSTKEIMKMTGHKSEQVFHNYYSIEDEDLLQKPNQPFIKKQNNYITDSKEDVDEVDIDFQLPIKQLTLKEKIIQLKELVEIGELSQKDFEKRKNKLISSI